MPKTAEPSRRIISEGSRPLPSAPTGSPGTAGIPLPDRSSGSWSRSTVARASATEVATGATRPCHAGSVASTHSDRLHACFGPPAGGRSVTASSHSSATPSASVAAFA